jgi:hypothetical protein
LRPLALRSSSRALFRAGRRATNPPKYEIMRIVSPPSSRVPSPTSRVAVLRTTTLTAGGAGAPPGAPAAVGLGTRDNGALTIRMISYFGGFASTTRVRVASSAGLHNNWSRKGGLETRQAFWRRRSSATSCSSLFFCKRNLSGRQTRQLQPPSTETFVGNLCRLSVAGCV